MRKTHPVSLALAVFLLLGLTPLLQAQEQGLRYTEVTRVEFAGALGALMSIVPGAQGETEETVYLQGPRMRSDSDDHSTIMDMESGVLFSLDHPNKQYFRLEIGKLDEMFGGVGMKGQGMERSSEVAADGHEELPEDSVEIEWEIDTERTGETSEIAGMEAERVLMTVTMEAIGRDEEDNEIRSGTMVLLTDLWLAENVPGMEAFDEASREMFLQMMGASGSGEGLSAAFEADPRIRVASEQARDELEDLRGFPVKSVSHFITVPQGLEFDREKALESADEPLAMDAGDLAAAAGKAAAESAAKSAAKSLTGGIGGLFGRKKEEEKEEVDEAPDPVQMTILRGTTMITELRTEAIPMELFQVPEDYREAELPTGSAGGPGQP